MIDLTTRNETIRALAAASAAEIRSRPDRALRAHSAVAGEITRPEPMRLVEHMCATRSTLGPHDAFGRPRCSRCAEIPPLRTTDRELPLERTPNHFTGKPRS